MQKENGQDMQRDNGKGEIRMKPFVPLFILLALAIVAGLLIAFDVEPAEANIEDLRYRRLYERQVAAEEKIAVSLDRIARCSCK